MREDRDGDSVWVMCETLGELESVQKQIREMQANGTAEAFLTEREKQRTSDAEDCLQCPRRAGASRIDETASEYWHKDTRERGDGLVGSKGVATIRRRRDL